MDENPAIRELDLAELLVRVTWVGSICYIVANLANEIERYNVAKKVVASMPPSAASMFPDTTSGYTFSYMLATLLSQFVYGLGLIVGAYVLRALIWIAVRHGAVPGQISPDEGS